jgi:asparagine synthase (glutamine-hydrolysing)
MLDERFSALDRAFGSAVGRWISADAPITLLFSGGVDSGLLAWELRHRANVSLLTVGVRGSADLREAEASASMIGSKWVRAEVTTAEVVDAAERFRADTVDLPRTTRSVLVAFGIALDRAPDRIVLCGQGVDELFLGYRHFHRLIASDASSRSESDLRMLLERDWPRSQQIAQRLGRTVFAPYLDPSFVAEARSIPIESRLPEPTSKDYFRRWAQHRGLPAAIATRPKRALQFGSGIDRLLPDDGPDIVR